MRSPDLNTVLIAVLAGAFLLSPVPAAGQENPKETGESSRTPLSQQSLPLRKSLHHNPTMKTPFERLVKLYRTNGKVKNLLEMYRSHVRKYPDDTAARTVYLRLLIETGRPADTPTEQAIQKHPENGYFRFLRYRVLKQTSQPKALDALHAAIDRVSDPVKKRNWIDILIEKASETGRRKLLSKQFDRLSSLAKEPGAKLKVARRMIRRDFPEDALAMLETVREQSSDPDTSVRIDMAAATAEVKLNRREQAAERLDKLLKRLTPDYWRRDEIWQRRISLIQKEEQRKQLVKKLQERIASNPKQEAPVLDLSRLLWAMERRRDAIEVLMQAEQRLPESQKLEERTLKLLNRLMDDQKRLSYLKQRLDQFPGREDLRYRYVKTLFLLGKKTKAFDELEALTQQLDEEAQQEQLLQLARFLRESALPEDAAAVYEKLHEQKPNLLNIRRELAETYLATGRRRDARKIMQPPPPEQTPIEDLLDTSRFLLSEELYEEARSFIRPILEDHSSNLELRLQLVRAHNQLGNGQEAQNTLSTARDLADTPPRYRRWLKRAVQFHQSMDKLEEFLSDERERLPGFDDDDTKRKTVFKKHLIFANVAEDHNQASLALDLLRGALSQVKRQEREARFRSELIRLLDEQDAAAGEVEKHLDRLANINPDASGEVKLRRALLKLEAGKQQNAAGQLAQTKINSVDDPDLLNTVLRKLEELLTTEKRIAILERLTEINPSSEDNWEHLITALASHQRESHLRRVLKKLLAGVQKLSLDDDVKQQVHDHLAGSYWRSIATRIEGGASAAYADALALLNHMEKSVKSLDQRLWTFWTRAFLLDKLDRTQARKEAVREFTRLAEQQTKKKDTSSFDSEAISFPGGTIISRSFARDILDGQQPSRDNAPSTSLDALPERADWVFETVGNEYVTSVNPLPESGSNEPEPDRILVRDASNTLYMVDGDTGKVTWTRSDVPGVGNAGSGKPVIGSEGNIFLPAKDDVYGLSPEDGSLIWRADVTGPGSSDDGHAHVGLHGNLVIGYVPNSSTVSAFERSTGRLQWTRSLSGVETGERTSSGLRVSQGRLFLYGRSTAILDAEDGSLQMLFHPPSARTFPVDLDPSNSASSPSSSARRGRSGQVAASWSGRGRGISRQQLAQLSPRQRISYMHMVRRRRKKAHHRKSSGSTNQFDFSATDPVVRWTRLLQNDPRSTGLLHGRRMIFGLERQSSVGIYDLFLPFASGQNLIDSIQGTLIGITDRRVDENGQYHGKLCVIEPTRLQLISLRTGQRDVVQVPDSFTDDSSLMPQTMVTDQMVLVSTNQGLLQLNARTGKWVKHIHWPESSPMRTRSVADSRSSDFQADGIYLDSEDREGVQKLPQVASTDNNRLYTLANPWTLVSLSTEKKEGDGVSSTGEERDHE